MVLFGDGIGGGLGVIVVFGGGVLFCLLLAVLLFIVGVVWGVILGMVGRIVALIFALVFLVLMSSFGVLFGDRFCFCEFAFGKLVFF